MHTIFILLFVIMLTGFIGAFFSKPKEGEKPTSKKDIVRGGAIILGILLVLIAVTGGKEAPAASRSTSTPSPKCAKSDDKCVITQAVNKAIVDDNGLTVKNLEIANYDGGGYGVYVDYSGGAADVKGQQLFMEDGYLALHKTGLNIRTASFFAWVDVQDKYGNKSQAPYYKTLISADDWSKINWNTDDDNLKLNIFPSVWSVTQDYSSQIH